jgi:hypothetical protein
MVVWWVLRMALVIGAFFVGGFASFLALMLITWDQGVIDFFGTLAGVALSALVFIKTRFMTQPRPERPS